MKTGKQSYKRVEIEQMNLPAIRSYNFPPLEQIITQAPNAISNIYKSGSFLLANNVLGLGYGREFSSGLGCFDPDNSCTLYFRELIPSLAINGCFLDPENEDDRELLGSDIYYTRKFGIPFFATELMELTSSDQLLISALNPNANPPPGYTCWDRGALYFNQAEKIFDKQFVDSQRHYAGMLISLAATKYGFFTHLARCKKKT